MDIASQMDVITRTCQDLKNIEDEYSNVLEKIAELKSKIKWDERGILEYLENNEDFKQAIVDSARAVLPDEEIYTNIEFGLGANFGFGVYFTDEGRICIDYSGHYKADTSELFSELFRKFEKEIKNRVPKTLALDPNLFKARLSHPQP